MTDKPLLTLSTGHPQRGFIGPDVSYQESDGPLDPEHQKIVDAQKAEAEAVAKHEDKVARADIEAQAKEDKRRNEEAAKA